MNLISSLMFSELILAALKICVVGSLQCHVCSTGNPGQEDCGALPPESTKYLENCTAPSDKSCRIQEQWVDFEVLKQKHEMRTIRQCASTPYDPERACYYRTGFGGRISICNCVEDGCNGASVGEAPLLMSTFVITLIIHFWHLKNFPKHI
ncbi:uncharacterized protein LOC118187792 [Stegodyphus dumicola]|uniref:uncharacterized protein LOC118187792 n=1 Tax=Stegodyphus dumicola TaxID=202533 RepID=UPI0015B2428B|nr:uncharacterized protein LOC118187792 [Stegodyphus dumicola]